MKVAVFQMDVMQGAVEWNLDKASLWIEGVKAEVAVLPELVGGYVEGLRKVCMKCGRAVCFWDEEGFCFIRPDGAIERGAGSFEGMTFESERIGVVNCGGYVISAAAVGMGVCSVVDLRGRVVAKADPDLECAFVANLDKEFRTFGS